MRREHVTGGFIYNYRSRSLIARYNRNESLSIPDATPRFPQDENEKGPGSPLSQALNAISSARLTS